MSRIEVWHKDKGLAFGNDHFTGNFIQIWKRPKDPEERKLQDTFGMNPEDMLVDEDERFTGLNRTSLCRLIKKHGFTEEELVGCDLLDSVIS